MDKFLNKEQLYNYLYSSNYREKITGYEVARWKALEHFIKRVLKLERVRSLLDYGSGSGLHINLWKKLFPSSDLFFCDISSVALKKLKGKYPEFKNNCREVKNNKAPFKNDFFDVIVSIEVMEHVENLDKYLKDIYRLLKPGGIFVWTTPCANNFSIEHLYSKITNQIEKTKERYRRWAWEDPTHLRRLKSKELRNEMLKVGFNNIRFRFRAHFFSFICTQVLKRRLGK